jgi:hypothetical protein
LSSYTLSDLIGQAEAAGASFTAVHIPDAKYVCKVTHSNFKKTNDGLKDGYGVRVEVLDGPNKGKGWWTNHYLSPNKKDGEVNTAGIAIFFRQLAALGVDTELFKQGLTVENATKDNALAGAIVEVETEAEEYRGETRTKSKNYKPATGYVPAADVPAAPAQPAPVFTPPAPPAFNPAPAAQQAPAPVTEAPAPAPTTPF